MKKIKSLFKRDFETHLVYDEVTEGCEWVKEGEGIATQKLDGTACMVESGKLYKRYDVKKGRPTPKEGIPCEKEPDKNTGHWPWWIPVGDGPEDKYFREAFSGHELSCTYELVGPKINGNKEAIDVHKLFRHGRIKLEDVPIEFEKLQTWLSGKNIEGIVWHHADGEMVKIKKKDFGLKW